MSNVSPYDVWGRKDPEKKPKSRWIPITPEWRAEHMPKPTGKPKDALDQALEDMKQAGTWPPREGEW